MRTPSPSYCRLDLAPPLADRFIFGVAPIDYGPVLLLMPFGFHLAMDTLPSGATASGGFRSTLAVSGFRLRARLGFSIPSNSLRPARHYPRFRIRCSSSEHRRDFNPPEQCAAQRTLFSQSDFRQVVRSSSPCKLVGPYKRRLNLTDLPCSHEILWPHAGGTNPGSIPRTLAIAHPEIPPSP